MHWLSKSAETLIEACSPHHPAQHTLDVAVIGSGYGGAVAALRFAEHGLDVAVLERGNEYVAGEFPNNVSQAGKHVRTELATMAGVTTQGNENGLFDFRIGLRAGALVGNGLGGGSLINAGVGLKPDERVFKQVEWPAALRQENLDRWYKKARDMHELQTPSGGRNQPLDMTKTSKFQRLKDLQAQVPSCEKQVAGDIEVTCTFEAAPIAVQLESPPPKKNWPRDACNGCGDCITGCNYNAKLTLTATYLPEAVQAGADIFTGLTVLHISYEPKENLSFPWVVHYIRTSERKLQHNIANNKDLANKTNASANPNQWIYQLRARRVVISAGTFGSTEILLRSRAMGLSLSNTALGTRVSGNGDDVAYGYDMKADANATGWGSRPSPSTDPTQVVGPTITSIIRFTDKADLKRSTLIQDGAVPGLISGAVDELITTLATVAQIGKVSFRKCARGDPLAIQPEALKRTLTLLGMGHDSAGGTIVYDVKADRVGWGWPEAAKEKTPKLHRSRMRGLVKKMGGLYLQNPAAGLLPDSLGAAQNGPKVEGLIFTVHPLGGCRMGDSFITSVVNHWGCAWTADGALHDGLYVMDGSTLPSSLGANPMLTITALSERACSLILQDIPKSPQKGQTLLAYPVCPQPLVMKQKPLSTTVLAEVLRGKLNFARPMASSIPAGKNSTALFLEFAIDDWQGLLQKEIHKVTVLPAESGTAYKNSRLVIDHTPHPPLTWPEPLELLVTGGKVDLFYQQKSNCIADISRYSRTLATYAIHKRCPERAKKKTLENIRRDHKKQLVPETKVVGLTLKRLITSLRKTASAAKSEVIDFIGFFLLCKHANEVRAFDYKLELKCKADPKKTYTLIGKKTIEAAASWSGIYRWWRTRGSGWPVLERRSVWQQLTELDIKLYEGSDTRSQPIAEGTVVMDLPDMLRRVVPELKTQGDSLSALLELAGYPMLFLRGIFKTRLFDLTLPDYNIDSRGESALPDTDPALVSKPPGYFELDSIHYPNLTLAGGHVIKPEVKKLEVRQTWRKNRSEDADVIRLGLVRYKPKNVTYVPENNGIYKAKSIILMNGFDLSTKPFVAQELNNHGGNLATNLLNAGWDVWLFEYRASPLLDSSARYATMDDIAAFDIPAAIDHILSTVSTEIGTPLEWTQMFAFTHCVGSASMAMSLLGGYLKRNEGAPKLAGVSFSQFHTHVVGSTTAQMRLQLAALLSNILKIETLEFTANTVKPDFLYSMMDRLFATSRYWHTGSNPDYAHQTYNQCCPGDNDLRVSRPDSTTCKRMTGLLSRLFEHDQLLPETHEKLDDYFGRSNLGVFMQGAKCTEYERLVNADGQNVYVTDANIRNYFTMPLMLIHGQNNVLFNNESASRSWAEMQRIRSASPNIGLDVQLSLPNYAHFDCTIGKTAGKDIFQPTVKFFNQALALGVSSSAPNHDPSVVAPTYRARLPRTGPIVGWVRPGSATTTLARVWMEIDTVDSEKAVEVLSFVTHSGTVDVKSWKPKIRMLRAQYFVPLSDQMKWDNHIFPAAPAISYAVAEIEIPNLHLGSIKIDLVSVHAPWQPGGAPSVLMQTAVTPQALIDTMEQELGANRSRTRQAEPDTLSRRRRTLRAYPSRFIKLNRAQLETNSNEDWSFIAGGCKHPGLTGLERDRADASLNAICSQLDKQQPRFMLMLGDQIYVDARAGVMDTQSPVEKLLPRYRGAFGRSSGFRKLAQRLPMYMVMDDHEINDNWSQEQQLTSYANKVLAKNARAAFGVFQYAHGPGMPARVAPQPGGPSVRVNGFNYSYEHNGIPFLVLDTRTQRKRVPTRQLLHASQWLWLEQWLLGEQKKGSHPKFVVSGSVVVPGLQENAGTPSPRNADTWQMSGQERARLLSFIAENNIHNVVFLSSDYHCSAAATITFSNSPVKTWAIVAPPMHAPMRFANVQASEVFGEEDIQLNQGCATVMAETWDGEGWLTCQVTKPDSTHFNLELTFNLRKLDEEAWPATPTSRTWPM